MVNKRSLVATTVALISVSAILAAAEAADGPAHAAPVLASQDELKAINLSVIDRKVTLSLAVEMHIQVVLAASALDQIQDPNFRRLVEDKQRLYRELFETLDCLVAGEASSMLGDAGDPGDYEPAPQVTRRMITTRTMQTVIDVRLR